MNLFLDSSALLKRYIDETGSHKMEDLFGRAATIFVSSITQVECASAFQRLFHTHHIGRREFQKITLEANLDFSFFQIVDFDDSVRDICLALLTHYPMKTADTIQLASLLHAAGEVESFVVSDQQLKKYAVKEGIHVIDPTQ